MTEVKHGGNYKGSDRMRMEVQICLLLLAILGEMKTTEDSRLYIIGWRVIMLSLLPIIGLNIQEKSRRDKTQHLPGVNRIKNRVEKFYSGFHKKYPRGQHCTGYTESSTIFQSPTMKSWVVLSTYKLRNIAGFVIIHFGSQMRDTINVYN